MNWNDILGISILISTVFSIWYARKIVTDGKEHPFF